MFELAALIPNGIAQMDFYLLIAASFVTSLITAAFGIGGGVILLVLMAMLVPPAALIPIHGIVQLGSNGGRVAIMAKDVVWRPIMPFVIGSTIGAIAGGLVAVQLPNWLVQLGLGVFIIIVVFTKLPSIQHRYIFAGGMISSFLTMFFGATGNFIAAMVKTMTLPPLPHVATHSMMMTFQHLIKVIVFGIVGFHFADYWALVLGMLVSGFVGTVIGRQFLVKAGQRYFKPILNTVLTLAACRLIYAGITGLIGV
jgi:uncharacterized membrane protein YfcA